MSNYTTLSWIEDFSNFNTLMIKEELLGEWEENYINTNVNYMTSQPQKI